MTALEKLPFLEIDFSKKANNIEKAWNSDESVERSFARLLLENRISRNTVGFEKSETLKYYYRRPKSLKIPYLKLLTDPNIQGVLTNFRSTLTHLMLQIAHQDEKKITLENKFTDSKFRMSYQDSYSSKDCSIFFVLSCWSTFQYVTQGRVQCHSEVLSLPNWS